MNYSAKLLGKAIGLHNKKVYETECYRYGMKGHWSRTCRTAKHLVDLYQASMKGKDKKIETNFIDGKDTMDPNDHFFDDDGAVPFYLNFIFILKIYGSLLRIDQLYVICW